MILYSFLQDLGLDSAMPLYFVLGFYFLDFTFLKWKELKAIKDSFHFEHSVSLVLVSMELYRLISLVR